MINGLTELTITKLDVLSGLDELKVCTSYVIDGKETTRFSSDLHTLERVEPVYETLSGWSEDIVGVDQFDDLPDNAKTYLQFISDKVGVDISMVSTGPKRSQTIARSEALLNAMN